MKGNHVFVNDNGQLEVTYKGDQTGETINTVFQACQGLSQQPIDYLINLSDMGKSDLGARRAAVVAINKLKFRRQALFGGNHITKSLMNWMILGIGKGDKIRYFDTRSEAESWLKAS